jgi:hypothetical protein
LLVRGAHSTWPLSGQKVEQRSIIPSPAGCSTLACARPGDGAGLKSTKISQRNMRPDLLKVISQQRLSVTLAAYRGGCRLGLRVARPAPTGSATASRQAGTHNDSAFQLQYSYC